MSALNDRTTTSAENVRFQEHNNMDLKLWKRTDAACPVGGVCYADHRKLTQMRDTTRDASISEEVPDSSCCAAPKTDPLASYHTQTNRVSAHDAVDLPDNQHQLNRAHEHVASAHHTKLTAHTRMT